MSDSEPASQLPASQEVASSASQNARQRDIQNDDIQRDILVLWERRSELSPDDTEAVQTVHRAIDLLDQGTVRVAEIQAGSTSGDLAGGGPTGDDPTGAPNSSGNLATDEVVVNEWLKYAILLLFKLSAMEVQELAPFEFADKIPLKSDYQTKGVRVVPGASARWGSYLSPGVVMMPSYVNIGAYVGRNTMVDTWATVGSCAQIGDNVHLSGGVGIGGVLEPPQAAPVIVGDDCLIGSRCIVAEGARVGDGVVLGAGCILTSSIPVIDTETGEEVSRGVVPPWCVAVSGTRLRQFAGGEFGLPVVLIIKRLEEKQRHDKSALNDILREHAVAT